jgi:3-hydroxyisobutyrate dehydrogenase-like beta-hydroxyacid dehydrogenase
MRSSSLVAKCRVGRKMGMRVSNNLAKTDHTVFYSENSPAGQERVLATGRTLTDTDAAIADADVVVMAVPGLALGPVSEAIIGK